MRRLGAIARQEWRLQIRSSRFRFSVLGYLVLSAVPPAVLFFLVRRYSLVAFGPTTYLAQALIFQPCLAILLAILLVGGRTGAESLREQWSPLASAPLGGLGFLGRRWLALLALLVPLTLAPLLVAAGFAYAAEAPVVEWKDWFLAWLVVVLPRALLTSAAWLALVTIAGSELLALVFALLGLAALQSVLNQVLLRFNGPCGGLTNGSASTPSTFGRSGSRSILARTGSAGTTPGLLPPRHLSIWWQLGSGCCRGLSCWQRFRWGCWCGGHVLGPYSERPASVSGR